MIFFNTLMYFYSHKVVNDVTSDFAFPKSIMQHYKLPSCFNCETYQVGSNYKLPQLIEFEKKNSK